MKQQKKMIPIGIEDFKELRSKDFYYVDKTGMIRELLTDQTKVTLFTRPRRFGKSLNMSMLAHFFSLDCDKRIFDGLEISKETVLCEQYMGKYPVISLTLKGIDKLTYEAAYQRTVQLVTDVAGQFEFLLDSDRLSSREKKDFRKLLDETMDEATLGTSLKLLSELLEKHFGAKVILLIDEYDVPLQKAFTNGYYDRMVSLIRSLLGEALKTNPSLEFAVLTGCLRVSKESIFTGLNNLKVMSVTNAAYDESFGFTCREVRDLLDYYELENAYESVREWYDGYQFGNAEIYCPWDVVNYCFDKRRDPGLAPQNYWINSSGNDAVKRFIEQADGTTRLELERLVAGETVPKEIHEDLTYNEIYKTIDHLWSLLFMTGYLTQRGEADGRRLNLAIPNLEVREIFTRQIMECFTEAVRKDGDTLGRFCDALMDGDADTVEQLFTQYLRKTASIRDTGAKDDQKESFYHGILLGILGIKESWAILSNREASEGYADILVRPEDGPSGDAIGIIIEVKYAHDGNLEQCAKAALRQIEERHYTDALYEDGADRILKYGIGCHKKRCRVLLGK